MVKLKSQLFVNVLYRTAAENITDAQIQSQIDVLNQDFNAANSVFSDILLNSLVAANVESLFLEN
jgi:tRNA1(Val) A37 N6-methylase TrmN6